MSDLVKFKKGQSANLSSTAITPGQILISTDTGEMHVDYDDNGTSKRVKIKDPSVATNYVSKSGDVMTGALYIDVTSSSLPNMINTDTYVRGLLGAKLSSSVSIPLIYCATQNNGSGGAGICFTGKGLTIIGAGENGPSTILNNAAQQSGTINGYNGTTSISPLTEELVLSSDSVISFYPGSKTDSYASQINTSGTFIGPTADAATIQSSLVTGTYLNGNQGIALVNSTATAGSYVTLLKSNSTNGYFTVANYGTNFKLQYTTKTAVDGGTNSVNKAVTLLDESGNTSFAGTVTVGTPTANTHAATKAYVDNHTHTLSLATDSGTNDITLAASTKYKLTAGGSTYIFTTPPNTDTHYTTHLYAGSGSAANAATTNGNTKITVVDNSAVRNNVTIKGILGTDVSSDASGNISIGNGIAKLNQAVAISSTEANNWQLIANGEMTGSTDINMLFVVTDNCSHANGLLSLAVRCANNKAVTDQSANNGPRLEWISRHKDINPNQYRLRVSNYTNSSNEYTRCTWELEAYHHRQFYTVSFEVIQASGNNGANVPAYTLHTDGPAVSSGGNLYTSRDVLPLGGTWESNTWNTSNAAGITIGEYSKCTTSTSGNIAIGGTGGRSTSATGSWAIAVGSGANSSGANATAVGAVVTASGNYSTALGYNNTASGTHAIAIGSTNTAAGIAVGYGNTASNSYTSAMGISNTASGSGSTAYGRSNTVSGENSWAIGAWNTLAGEKCFAIGSDNNLDSVVGNGGIKYMHRSGALGCSNTIQCSASYGQTEYNYAYAIGGYNTVHNTGIAIGCSNEISIGTTGSASRRDFSVCIGSWSECTEYNSYCLGYAVTNNSNGAFVCGRQNKTLTPNRSYTSSTTGDVFVVGNGYSQPSSSSETGYMHIRSNAFRVTYAGTVYSTGAYNTSGADYAEFVKEWWDGNPNNEDRVGYMVTIKNGKLHKANEGDYIIGITSGNPSVIGNADEDYYWMYERDEFNRIISEEVPDLVPKLDENGEFILDENEEIIYEDSGNTIKRFKFREDYDPTLQDSYIERKDRPEWDYVGMRGIVPCRDDGTCEEGGFCKCGSNGIATYSSIQDFNTYYVVERISENVVSIEVK